MNTRRSFLKNLLSAPAIAAVGSQAAPVVVAAPAPPPKIVTVEKIVTKEVVVMKEMPENIKDHEAAIWLAITANRRKEAARQKRIA